MHLIHSAYLYFCNLYKTLLLFEENEICKCCCCESGRRFCLSEVRWRRECQTNQSLCILVNTFFLKDKLFKNPINHTQNWLRHRGLENSETSEGGHKTWNRTDCLPAFGHHMRVTTKCPPTTGRISFSLPLNPLRYTERLWDLCSNGITKQTFIHFPSQRRNTFHHCLSSCFKTLLCGLHGSCHTSCIWEVSIRVAEEDGKRSLRGTSNGC